METLPIEVLANQIFKYFIFEDWLKTLVLVCKHWQNSAIKSTASKQLLIDLEDESTRYDCISTISRYRVDTIMLIDSIGPSSNLIERILNASPKLNTFVLLAKRIIDLTILTPAETISDIPLHVPKYTFPHITTMGISYKEIPLLPLFPNVTRLRIEDWELGDEVDISKDPIFPKIRELEITRNNPLYDLDRITHLFPNLEVLYLTVMHEPENATIFAVAKELGIKVYSGNPHLESASWDSSNISYYLFSMQHRTTPLLSALKHSNPDCTVEKFEEILSQTSPTYERELHDRKPEFYFPYRISHILREIWTNQPHNMRKPAFIKPLFTHGHIDFPTAFGLAVSLNNLDLALELAPTLTEHLNNRTIFSNIVMLLEKLQTPQQFIDAVGSEPALEKIMSYQDGCSVLEAWATHQFSDFTDWSPFEIYLDWNLEVKYKKNSGQITQEGLSNLATAAFKNSCRNQWKILVKKHMLEVDIDLYSENDFYNFFTTIDSEAIDLIAANVKPEKFHRVLYLAACFCKQDPAIVLTNLVTKYGSDSFRQCLDGKYLIHHLLQQIQPVDTLPIITYLVKELKLDINYIDKSGKTPLILCIEQLLDETYPLKDLLALGADPNLAGDSLLPLFLVIDHLAYKNTYTLAQCVDKMTQYGVNLNTVDFDKNGRKATPLYMAVSHGVTSLVQMLISYGADTQFIDDAGNTLLHTTLLADHLDTVINLIPILAKHTNINQKNYLGETPLHRSLLASYDSSIAKTYLHHGADVNLPGGPFNDPPLIMALQSLSTLKVLLNHPKININAKNGVGESMFYVLCKMGLTEGQFEELETQLTNSDFQEAIARHTTPENIEFIVSEVKRFMNDWPSHFNSIFALCSRNMSFLKFLVETIGFDINTKDRLGNTLLSSAPASAKNSFEIAEYLIQKGADVNTQDVFGDTPLLTAVRSTSLTREQYRFRQLLLKHGASISLKNNVGMAPVDLDPTIATRYNEGELPMAYYDDRTKSELLTPSLAQLRAKSSASLIK